LQLTRHIGGIPKPTDHALQGGPVITELREFLFEDAADVGQQLLTHSPLAESASSYGADGALDKDFQFDQCGLVHGGPITLHGFIFSLSSIYCQQQNRKNARIAFLPIGATITNAPGVASCRPILPR
jgi:hypothetical protein